ncbi:MAG: benzoyl-CoA reductase, bzd-type, subunit N [Deltaproteobacteria bacterium]|nr:benzoyl-CoA reductase, bzd-type, subunit N [Deltaproteobacteria bacterium]
MFERFREWEENRHQYAKDWKERTGGKILGYFCSYLPEEIIYAADVLPVRIFGSHEAPDDTEPHIFGMFCPFCRDCLSQGLKGRYDYLDAIAGTNTCIHINQSFESWSMHIPVSHSLFFNMPNTVQTERARPYLAGEMAEFKRSVEEWTGRTITDKGLDRTIDLLNTNRRLMKQIYELRKGDPPSLSGVEAMEMVLSSQLTHKEEHNQELERVLKELPERNTKKEAGARLMIVGSEDDDIEFLEMVESLDATFVIDDHCTGSRYFWNEVIPDDNRLKAIANRYLDRPPCPSKDWPRRSRVPHILNLAKEYRVQGAVLMQQKFCDPHEADIPTLKTQLEKNGIPTYFLEFDVTVPIGQFKIRIEAFLEMLRAEELPF